MQQLYVRCSVLVVLALGLIASVQAAPPPLPFTIAGNVSIDDTPAPVGTELTAIDSEGKAVADFTVQTKGTFGPVSIPADDPDTLQKDGAVADETIQWQVDGTMTDNTFLWESGGFNYQYQLDVVTTSSDDASDSGDTEEDSANDTTQDTNTSDTDNGDDSASGAGENVNASNGGDTGSSGCTDCDGDGFSQSVDCLDNDPTIHPNATEICDGIDNDCDGEVDEGLVRSCGNGTGICQQGTQSCNTGAWGACTGGVGPMEEICDGKDNDCDGKIDENAVCTPPPKNETEEDSPTANTVAGTTSQEQGSEDESTVTGTDTNEKTASGSQSSETERRQDSGNVSEQQQENRSDVASKEKAKPAIPNKQFGNCTTDWVCTDWGVCRDGVQTRRCIDWNTCHPQYDDLEERTLTRNCTATTAQPAPTGNAIAQPQQQSSQPPAAMDTGPYVFGGLVALLMLFFGWLRHW